MRTYLPLSSFDRHHLVFVYYLASLQHLSSDGQMMDTTTTTNTQTKTKTTAATANAKRYRSNA
jgi:hypothetical protein